MLFGLQGCINMAVNLQLMPAKGMTCLCLLWRSSLISLALGTGFLLAVTRRRPRAHMVARRADHAAEAESAAPMAGAPA